MSGRPTSETEILRRYLAVAFEALRWKLDGLSEYDLRRPLVPSGTNLLGIAKHVAYVSAGYFGPVFGRPTATPDFPEHEINADMWATADETSDHIKGLLDIAAAEVDAALAELAPDAPGHVPWWGGDAPNTSVRFVAVHLLAEVNRHTGQADIVRENLDARVGLREGGTNLPGPDDGADAQWWADYRDRLQEVAESFR